MSSAVNDDAALHELAFEQRLVVVAQQVRQLLANLYKRPLFSDRGWTDSVSSRAREFGVRLTTVGTAITAKASTLKLALSTLSQGLEDFARELGESPSVKRLRALRKELGKDYEAFVAEAKALKAIAAQIPHHKPTNYARHAFHASMGLVGVLLYELFITQAQAVGILVTLGGMFLVLEITRRLSKRWNDFLVDRVFGAISRPRERYLTNSATYYLTALFLIVWLLPKPAAEIGVLVLAFSDPAASLIGQRFGRKKIYRDKSIWGSAAFFFTAAAVTGIFLGLTGLGIGLVPSLGLMLTVAVAGSLTELFSDRIDDNFSVPVVSALAAWAFLAIV